jgi:hypothetical protein
MVARAIGYASVDYGDVSMPKPWIFLLDGSSDKDILGALEDLWNRTLARVPESTTSKLPSPNISLIC